MKKVVTVVIGGRARTARAVLPTDPEGEALTRRLFKRALGGGEVGRASNVEPDLTGGWTAAICPGVARGAPVLGPFRLRAEAIAAEIDYLDRAL